jgi:hypothetical protein
MNSATGEIISMSSASYSGSFIKQDVWASFNGKEQALSARSLSLISAASRIPAIPPGQDQLNVAIENAVQKLISELGNKLN